MPGGSDATLLEAFGLEGRRYVHLIGGGGKTTLMFAAARALAGAAHSVLTTTTTRILVPEPGESECVVSGTEARPLAERLRREFATRRHVTAVAPDPAGGRKAGGLSPAVLDALLDERVADHLLVEADGAAGRSLKAHADHEPVVSPRGDLVIAVIGVDCLGLPMDDAHVHRAALLRERLGRPDGALVAAADVGGILFHPEGYFRTIGPDAARIVFLNKAGTPEALRRARALAATLEAMVGGGRVGRIVIGDVKAGTFETHGPA
jgi:probable selenium-dependent hydroxylase accessory protein YqeC